ISNIRPYFKKIWQADNIGGISNDVLNITSSNEKLSNDYLYYYLSQDKFFQYMTQTSKGTKMPRGDKEAIMEFEIQVPKNVKYQNFIGNLGKILDNKIKINNEIIANLEELSQTLFKRWFLDFEFPDEDGNPYKSSGGEMVSSELGEIPKNWSIKIVKEIAESFNSIRKPLSKFEREKRESIYPYYGATKIIDYVDNYIFDGKYILVGEDGTVQTEAGNPFIQYVWGKFWVSNHAHILKGKLISDELLMLYLKNTNVAPYITGAVQPKLNKKNLNSIKFVIADKETIIKFENFIKSYFQKIRILNKENKKLIELRDTLLPKFMSGELEIPDDIEVNSDELSI
uniref:restriction endonuclease subunit S n=1 Tax=Staphylococcus hominis TaxID=1290 RepID=UPI0034D3CFAE